MVDQEKSLWLFIFMLAVWFNKFNLRLNCNFKLQKWLIVDKQTLNELNRKGKSWPDVHLFWRGIRMRFVHKMWNIDGRSSTRLSFQKASSSVTKFHHIFTFHHCFSVKQTKPQPKVGIIPLCISLSSAITICHLSRWKVISKTQPYLVYLISFVYVFVHHHSSRSTF